MKFVPRSELPAALRLVSSSREAFDQVVVRFANNNFAQDDKNNRNR
jgi:hypothetical protein